MKIIRFRKKNKNKNKGRVSWKLNGEMSSKWIQVRYGMPIE